LTRLTAIIATLFFLTSMALAYFATQGAVEPAGLMDKLGDTAVIDAAPAPSATATAPDSDIPAVPGASGSAQAVDGSDVPAVSSSAVDANEQEASPAADANSAPVKPAEE
jgi:preprotein translocase subunit SecG